MKPWCEVNSAMKKLTRIPVIVITNRVTRIVLVHRQPPHIIALIVRISAIPSPNCQPWLVPKLVAQVTSRDRG